MKRLSRACVAVVAVVVLGFSLVACGKQGGSIKIGVISSVTGGGAAFGVNGNNAIKLAIEEINQAGGIKGKTLEAIYLDSQSVPTTAVNLVQKLIYEDKVSVVVGSTASLDTLAMMPVTEKEKIPLLCPSCVSAKITEGGSSYIWRGTATDNMMARDAVKYAVERLGWKKIAIMYENSEYGAVPAKQVRDVLINNYKMEPAAFEAYNRGDPDFTGTLTVIREMDVDGIVAWGYYSDVALIVRQARQVGVKASFMSNSGSVMSKFVELVGDDGENMMFVVSYTATDPRTESREFVKRFEGKYGYYPDNCAAYSYDCMRLLAKVLEEYGTESEAIREGLTKIQYEGVTGKFKFDNNGQNTAPSTIVVLKNGIFEVVEE